MKKMFALFMALLLMLSFTACGSKEATVEATTEVTTETTTEPAAKATEYVADYDTVAVLLEAAGVTNWDYWNADVKDDVFIVSFSTKGMKDGVTLFKAAGYDETNADWVSIKETMMEMYQSNVNLIKTLGIEDPNSYLNLVSDKDHDEILVSIYNGEIVYDVMESEDIQQKGTDEPVDQKIKEPQDITMGQKNALASAESYLKYSSFSHNGLIDQLEYEGFTTEEATFAADNCGADWNEQALAEALSYLNYSAFSYTGLIDQLEYEEYTTEQARYAVDNCGADWNEQAAKSAESYLKYSSFSRTGLIDQLEYEGFTHEQAVYGAEANGY